MKGDEKLNSEISDKTSQYPLFDSMIKTQMRQDQVDEAFSEPRVSNFDQEELVEILDFSP